MHLAFVELAVAVGFMFISVSDIAVGVIPRRSSVMHSRSLAFLFVCLEFLCKESLIMARNITFKWREKRGK